MVTVSLSPARTQLECFHGTNIANQDSIIKSGFNSSGNPDDWLGRGVYFFVDGIGEPHEHAEEWAKAESRKKGYTEFSVLKAIVKCPRKNLYDSREEGAKDAFVKFKMFVLDRLEKEQFQKGRIQADDDRKLWDLFVKHTDFKVIIHDLYIGTRLERRIKLRSNMPNCTVACIKDEKLIEDSISIIASGKTQ